MLQSVNCINTLIIFYCISIFIFNNIDLNEAKLGRVSGGRIGGSRGGFGRGNRGGGHSNGGYGSSSPHGRPKPPVNIPAPPPIHHSPVSSSPPLHVSQPPPRHSPSAPPIYPPLNNHPIPKGPGSLPPSWSNPKDSSNVLIHNEGGGNQKPLNNPTFQNKPPGSSSNNYPPWANPSINSQSNSPLTSPSAPHIDSRPIGAPPSTYPHSGSVQLPLYPNTHPIGMPKPLNVNNQKAPTLGNSAPSSYGPPPVYGVPSNTHGGFGPPPNYYSPSYGQTPSYYQSTGINQPNYIHPPSYSVQGGGNQPFVPGQSVIVLPSASGSKGPGLGQMVKEALVFSTINAGVNRIINGAPHHHYNTYYHGQRADPVTTSTITNNTTIINNNYGNLPIEKLNDSYPNKAPNYYNGNLPSYNLTNYTSGVNINSNNTFNNINYNPNNSSPSHLSNISINNSKLSNATNNNNVNSSLSEESMPLNNYYITENELIDLTEKLFSQNEMNMNQQLYVLNLQKKVSNVSDVKDEASQLLLYLDSKVYSHPTVSALRNIYDDYEFNSTKKENTTKVSRMNQAFFIDTILNTNIMTTTIQWLQEKYYIEPDEFEVKDTLKRIWFSKMNGYTSGFERIFMAEWYPGPSLLGGHNWIYYDYEEYQKNLNYLSYIDKIDMKNNLSLIKINIEMNGIIKPNVTMLVGTPPELEMALYTICYYARPNDICKVSLGKVVLNIYTHTYRYFGKDLIDLGLIMF